MTINNTELYGNAAASGSEGLVTLQDLLQTRVFAGEDAEVIDWLLDACATRKLAVGDKLFVPGQINHLLYLVMRGELVVQLEGESEETLDIIRAGDCVGEMSVLEGMPASAHVVATTDTLLFAIKDVYIWSLIDRSHVIARNLLLILSGRIRKGQRNLSDSYQMQRTYEQDAKIDCLTGLFNRRWLNDSLPRLVQRNPKLSLLILDIDNFKNYNDMYGHQAGDRILSAVAQTLTRQLRPTDMAARYGGEEFVALLPDTDGAEALDVAERIRIAVSAQVPGGSEQQPSSPVTVSIGLAQLGPGQDGATLLARADAALYRAKGAGRNCVRN